MSSFSPTDAATAFWREGFVATPPLIPAPTLQAASGEILRLWAEERTRKTKAHAVDRHFAEVRPELQRLHSRSPVLNALCRHPALLALAGAILGPDVDLFWNQAYPKLPSASGRTAIPWHQDGHYAEIDGRSLNAWIAITPATIENGTLWVIPGSHEAPLAPHEWDERLLFYRMQANPERATPIELEPGQVFAFGSRVIHGSSANKSKETRISYSINFATANARLRANGELFGDRMPVLRGGERVDVVLESFALAGGPEAVPTHPGAAIVDELRARAGDSRAVLEDLFARYRSAVASRASDADALLGTLLSVRPADQEVLGDLLRSRARVDQLLAEYAGLDMTQTEARRLLLARVLELDPGNRQALDALGT